MNRPLDVDSGQALMPAEAYTPENRALQFEVIAWGHSSDEYVVGTRRDEDDVMVECEVRRREGSPNFDEPLQRHLVTGVLEALNFKAGELGGEGKGPWTPDSESADVQGGWKREFTFLLEAPSVVDQFVPLYTA